ncbi:MAG: hypothetical protein H0U46_10920 [Actinobacteria bacterium]|nr:hypothetical protein [Actinomycetota bacterium]
MEALLDQANWYVQCLKDRIAGKPVRGLAEAEAGFDSALNTFHSLLLKAEEERNRWRDMADDEETTADDFERRLEAAEQERDHWKSEVAGLASEQRVADSIEAENEQLRVVANGVIWLDNNIHNYGSDAWRGYFKAVLRDARAALTPEETKEAGEAT